MVTICSSKFGEFAESLPLEIDVIIVGWKTRIQLPRSLAKASFNGPNVTRDPKLLIDRSVSEKLAEIVKCVLLTTPTEYI